jgi:ectoine hydroxylase-related dioxygenase (phytanoyl-CoA dioxygenase family)
MDSQLKEFAKQYEHNGFSCIQRVLNPARVSALSAALSDLPETEAVRRKDSIYGVRNLLDLSPAVCELATEPEIWRYAQAILGNEARAVRAIFFNKTADANWGLRWHQDSVIAVREQRDVSGYSAWACKAGVWQVRPPAAILSRMLAIRIHLDPCGVENGALRVLPGSHREGWVKGGAAAWKTRVAEVVCTVEAGGIVAMCPLLLHASAKAASPVRRRVIHIEYVAKELPDGLDWRWSLMRRQNTVL